MPSLAGLFGRKKKPAPASNVPSDFDSAQSSPTAEYVTPEKSLPSSPNGKTYLASHDAPPPNLHKLRLPFSRKKAATAASSTSVVPDDHDAVFDSPPRPGHFSARNNTSPASSTEPDSRRLRPPPSKSAIFAAYGDPQSALSTRSLPSQPSHPSLRKEPFVPPVPAKKSFLHWSRSSPKTTPRPGLTPASDIDSFNLKSFRHISSSPHPSSPNASSPALAPPVIPRPRGLSTASDASQRISVAAFREAQARRSTAGSPVPSNRAPSPLPSGFLRSSHQPLHNSRPYASGSDDHSSEDEDSDNYDLRHERQGAEGVRRQRTLTQRTSDDARGALRGRATKSEAGHGSSPSNGHPSRSAPSFAPMPRSSMLHNHSRDTSPLALPRAESSLGMQTGTRQRASVSTSAISPTAAAKRASIIAAANGNCE